MAIQIKYSLSILGLGFVKTFFLNDSSLEGISKFASLSV